MIFIHISAEIFCVMTFIALVVLGMAVRGVRCGNVGALQRILFAAWAGADNAGRSGQRNAGGFLDAGHGCGIDCRVCSVRIGIHAVQIIEIPAASIACRPIVGVERHRRFRVADDVGDIERVAGIRFAPERILADAVQNRFAVVHGQRRELRAVVKSVLANGRRERQLGGGQVDAALEPVCQIRNAQGFHILEPDLGDLLPHSRPRLIVCACKHRRFAAAGDGQPTLGVQRPFDAAARNRAAGRSFTRNGLHGDFFVRGAFIDRVFVIFDCKRRNAQRKHHTEGKQQCGEFLEILHHAASFSLTAAMVNTIVAALTFVTASDAETFAL